MSKIMIISHYNLNNGDRAMLEGTLEILKENGVDEVSLSVYDKSQFSISTQGIKLNVVPWGVKNNSRLKRLIFKKIYQKIGLEKIEKYIYQLYSKDYIDEVKKSDVILVSGGHHLTDIVGDDIFYMISYDIILPIILNKKVVLLSQTIGPFNNSNPLKVNILSYILNNSKYVAIRDGNSQKFISQFKLKNNNIFIKPDMVFGLYKELAETKSTKEFKSIGIALYGNYPGEEGNKKIKIYMDHLVALIDEIYENYDINFIPMEVKGTHRDDRELMKYIRENTNVDANINIMEDDGDILQAIRNFKKNDLIIAYKTHSVLFSLIQNIPVVAVAYHQKSIDFMEMYGLKEYAIWDKDVNKVDLKRLIDKVHSNSIEITNLEHEKSKLLYNELNDFIRNIISL